MKKTLIVVLLIVAVIQVSAQTFKEKKTYVRKHYYEIATSLNSYENSTKYYNPEGNAWSGVNYQFWHLNKKLIKVEYSIGEEGYGDTYSMYFAKGKIIFIFIETVDPEENSQERIYFYNEKIFDYLEKKAKHIDRETQTDFSKIKNQKSTKNFEVETKKWITEIDNIKAIYEK